VVQADNPFAAYLCIVSGCATLKKVKQQGDQLFLIPDSDDASHMPIILTQDDDVKIQGKVVDVFSFE
jgi:SOS-response transcriptional repressor LexA